MLRRRSATVGKGQVNMETENLWMKRLGRFKIKLKRKHCVFKFSFLSIAAICHGESASIVVLNFCVVYQQSLR